MPRVPVHHHKCQDCGEQTECGGALEPNPDGIPAIICRDFHISGGATNPDFLCKPCYDKAVALEKDATLWGV